MLCAFYEWADLLQLLCWYPNDSKICARVSWNQIRCLHLDIIKFLKWIYPNLDFAPSSFSKPGPPPVFPVSVCFVSGKTLDLPLFFFAHVQPDIKSNWCYIWTIGQVCLCNFLVISLLLPWFKSLIFFFFLSWVTVTGFELVSQTLILFSANLLSTQQPECKHNHVISLLKTLQ